MTRTLLGLVFLIGCSSDAKPAPSCFDAFTRFYAAGCTFVDLTTGQPVPQGMVIAECQSAAAAAPANCKDELDSWTTCINGSSPSGNQCNCSSEQMALLQCR